MKKLTQMRVQMGLRFLLLIGGLLHLAFAFGYRRRNNLISLIIGICAVSLMFNRDYYLPFLGETVMPHVKETNMLPLGFGKTDVSLKGLPPNSFIVFWAAMPGKELVSDPFQAYGDYANSGITKSDNQGNAVLSLQCPAQYAVRQKSLPKHVHYRVENPKIKGLFSKVYTKKMDC